MKITFYNHEDREFEVAGVSNALGVVLIVGKAGYVMDRDSLKELIDGLKLLEDHAENRARNIELCVRGDGPPNHSLAQICPNVEIYGKCPDRSAKR